MIALDSRSSSSGNRWMGMFYGMNCTISTVFVFAALLVFAIEDQNEWIGISGIPFPGSIGSFDVIELAG